MYSAPELVSNIESLAALPTVYYRVQAQLESPDSTIDDIARLMETDPALTTGVLKLVNSAFYGFCRSVESVERAITILGLQQTHELVLAISVSAIFNGIRPQNMDMRRYWQGCMMTALASRELAHSICHPACARLFVIGLLADIGHLVMYLTVPDLAISAQDCADAEHEPLYEAERRIVGCDFAEVGAALMDNWNLPPDFAEIVGAQISPRFAGDHVLEAEMLHIATAISSADRHDEPSDKALARLDPQIWDDLGLAPDSFQRMRAFAELNLHSCIATFFPTTPTA